jgi:eukaryotic-like serine/threonine-protein kinase
VKVLDFGLAKTLEVGGAGERSGLTQSPTITTPAMVTGVGMILGTAAYMAPEQARGKPADKRSDIWAFGCVLLEMLTGTRAFAGEDVSDTLASVLKSEPDWTRLPPDVPLPLRVLIRACLVKDMRQRVSDLAAAKFVLNELESLAAPPPDRSGREAPGASMAGIRRAGRRRVRRDRDGSHDVDSPFAFRSAAGRAVLVRLA